MFGKRKTTNDNFVMAAGRAVGNLTRARGKSPTAKPPMKGESKAKAKPFVRGTMPRQQMGNAGNLKKEL